MDQEVSLKVIVGTASAKTRIRGAATHDGLHQGIGHFLASSTRVECYFGISSPSAFDTGSIFSFCLKRCRTHLDSRYAFGRDFLLGLHMKRAPGISGVIRATQCPQPDEKHPSRTERSNDPARRHRESWEA
jgi:hypothetical protein